MNIKKIRKVLSLFDEKDVKYIKLEYINQYEESVSLKKKLIKKRDKNDRS